jgi:hypothetical protein
MIIRQCWETYQLPHQRARGEVGLQKGNHVPPGKEERASEDDGRRLSTDRLSKSVETRSR